MVYFSKSTPKEIKYMYVGDPTANAGDYFFRIMVHSRKRNRFDSYKINALNIIKTKQLRSTTVGLRPCTKGPNFRDLPKVSNFRKLLGPSC